MLVVVAAAAAAAAWIRINRNRLNIGACTSFALLSTDNDIQVIARNNSCTYLLVEWRIHNRVIHHFGHENGIFSA